ncbi:MAG: alpha/beta fold hydrolase [Rhodosalinus sp.]
MIALTRYGTPSDRPPLVIAHGLFGSGRNWGVIAKRLSDAREVLAVDMRNHGDSPWTRRHDYPGMAADLAEVIAAQGRDCDLLGHSMGGKAAMVLALTAPARLRRLIVADIAPVAYGHSQQPALDAMRGLDLASIGSRAEATDALAERLGGTAEARGLAAFLAQSLDVKAGRWRLNLDTLAQDMDAILGFPDIEGRFDGPALFLAGAESDYIQRAHRDAIKALFPAARFAKIPGAGHWLHADKPREFEAAARAFLDA